MDEILDLIESVSEDFPSYSCMLSYLSSLLISVLRSLDTEANTFYDRTNKLHDAALLTSYTQHALRPVIDSYINHIRPFYQNSFY